MTPGLVTDIIAVSIAVISLIFVMLNSKRANTKDIKEAVEKEDSKFDAMKESLVKLGVKLDSVNATVTETRTDIKTTAKDISNIQAHLATLDERMAAGDKRIASLENKVYGKAGEK